MTKKSAACFAAALFLLLLAPVRLPALDADEIRELAAAPHDRTGLVPQLRIYPEARKYRIRMSGREPGGPASGPPESIATEHTAQGRYLVSRMALPGTGGDLLMVVHYDERTATFKKWVLLPDGTIASSTGVANAAAQSVAWISDSPHGDPPVTVLGIETHTDDGTTWTETTLRDGKVVWILEGRATKLN